MSDVTCTWDEGEVAVSAAVHVIDTPNCHVFELDLTTKRPEVACTGSEGVNGLFTALRAGAATLGARESRRGTWTTVRFTGVNGNEWTLIADDSIRYTFRVALYRWAQNEAKAVTNSAGEVVDHEVLGAA